MRESQGEGHGIASKNLTPSHIHPNDARLKIDGLYQLQGVKKYFLCA